MARTTSPRRATSYGRFYTPSALTDSGNEPLGMLDLGSFSPTTNVLPAQQGVPQAYLSDPFPQGLTPAYGKSYGRYLSLGDAVTIDEYERRPPISESRSRSGATGSTDRMCLRQSTWLWAGGRCRASTRIDRARTCDSAPWWHRKT
jgi:hypothetical protein